jgi:glycosyltransferase involved in cell wall biosynthesis
VEWLEVLRLRRWEQSLTKRGWEVVVCSEVDRAALGGGRAIWIVPNGVDLPKAGEAGGSRQQDPILLFVGYMSYAPNVDAVTFFAHRVLPLIRREMPQAVFVIAGRDPSPTVRALHDGATIVVTGTVPDMEPYWRRAAISVAPIRVAGGTRIKILEAMAHRVPVVSTALGAEGLEALAGQHLLVADSPRDLAATCLRLLRDPSLGEPLTERGFDLVRTHYQWDQTRELVRQIVESSGARRDLARA